MNLPKSKWVWSRNSTITHRRPTSGTVWKSHRIITDTIHHEDKQSKVTSSLPIKINSNLERTRTIAHVQKTTTVRQHQKGHQPKPLGWGRLNTFYFALDFVVVKIQNVFSSHGCFQPIAMCKHRETIYSNKHILMKQKKWLTTHRYSELKKPRWPSQRQASGITHPFLWIANSFLWTYQFRFCELANSVFFVNLPDPFCKLP